MAKKAFEKLDAFLKSDEVLNLEGPKIQMLIEQRWVLEIIIESLEKEVSKKND